MLWKRHFKYRIDIRTESVRRALFPADFFGLELPSPTLTDMSQNLDVSIHRELSYSVVLLMTLVIGFYLWHQSRQLLTQLRGKDVSKDPHLAC